MWNWAIAPAAGFPTWTKEMDSCVMTANVANPSQCVMDPVSKKSSEAFGTRASQFIDARHDERFQRGSSTRRCGKCCGFFDQGVRRALRRLREAFGGLQPAALDGGRGVE